MTPVRLEPAAPRSRVKHSTTGPLRSLVIVVIFSGGNDCSSSSSSRSSSINVVVW